MADRTPMRAALIVALALALALLAPRPVPGAGKSGNDQPGRTRSVASGRGVARTAEDFDPGSISKVAFIPFTRVLPADGGDIAVCPFDRIGRPACPMGDAAEAELSREVAAALFPLPLTVEWIGQAKINEAAELIAAGEDKVLSPGGPLQLAIAKETGADAALFGFVYCYRNRSGNSIASGTPSAIGFSLHLADVRSGEEYWSFAYRDEQRPLSENLIELPLYLKRKGRWVTVDKLAEEGAAALADVFPLRKKGEEDKD